MHISLTLFSLLDTIGETVEQFSLMLNLGNVLLQLTEIYLAMEYVLVRQEHTACHVASIMYVLLHKAVYLTRRYYSSTVQQHIVRLNFLRENYTCGKSFIIIIFQFFYAFQNCCAPLLQ